MGVGFTDRGIFGSSSEGLGRARVGLIDDAGRA